MHLGYNKSLTAEEECNNKNAVLATWSGLYNFIKITHFEKDSDAFGINTLPA